MGWARASASVTIVRNEHSQIFLETGGQDDLHHEARGPDAEPNGSSAGDGLLAAWMYGAIGERLVSYE